MPICVKCGKMQSSAEMRKSKTVEGGYVCKDATACKTRVTSRKKEEQCVSG